MVKSHKKGCGVGAALFSTTEHLTTLWLGELPPIRTLFVDMPLSYTTAYYFEVFILLFWSIMVCVEKKSSMVCIYTAHSEQIKNKFLDLIILSNSFI